MSTGSRIGRAYGLSALAAALMMSGGRRVSPGRLEELFSFADEPAALPVAAPPASRHSPGQDPRDAADKIARAEEKRQRKLARNRRLMEGGR